MKRLLHAALVELVEDVLHELHLSEVEDEAVGVGREGGEGELVDPERAVERVPAQPEPRETEERTREQSPLPEPGPSG